MNFVLSHELKNRADLLAKHAREISTAILGLEEGFDKNRKAALRGALVAELDALVKKIEDLARPHGTRIFEKDIRAALAKATGGPPELSKQENWIYVTPRAPSGGSDFKISDLPAKTPQEHENVTRQKWRSGREVWMTLSSFLESMQELKSSILRGEKDQYLSLRVNEATYRRMLDVLHLEARNDSSKALP